MFLDFSMIEIPFTYHDIHLLEGHDLMDFRKLMDLWTPHGNLLLEDFYHSKRKASACLLSPLVSTLTLVSLLSVAVGVPIGSLLQKCQTWLIAVGVPLLSTPFPRLILVAVLHVSALLNTMALCGWSTLRLPIIN